MGDGPVGVIILDCKEKTCSSHVLIRNVSQIIFDITGLRSSTQYFFKAHIANAVTILTGHVNQVEFNLTTKTVGEVETEGEAFC